MPDSLPQPNRPVVHIIGAGLAGLAAATCLAECGVAVKVLETHTAAGGRAASFDDAVTGDRVDHGQHLLIGAYQETRRFLERIGTFDRLHVADRVRVDFLHPQRGVSSLNCPNLPAPFHLLVGLLRLTHLSVRDKLHMMRLGSALLHLNPATQPELDDLTVAELLQRYGQTETSCREFWDILTVAVLNEVSAHASAALFITVMREAFLSRRDFGRAWLPKTGLGDVYTTAACDYIHSRGGVVEYLASVKQMTIQDNRLTHLHLKNQPDRPVEMVISTVPPFILQHVLPDPIRDTHFTYLSKFEPSSIVGINLWWDRAIMSQPFVGLIDSPIEWVFDKARLYDPQLATGSHLALVVSAANHWNRTPRAEIERIAVTEIQRFFPRAREARLRHSSVIKSKRATFAQKAGMHHFRPDPQTPIPNLFLAGDWTNTGLPATIESAVLSGHRAADLILQKLQTG